MPQNPALWKVDQYPAFLAQRRQLLADAINTFMDPLLSQTTATGYTIDDFIARGEGPQLEFKSSLCWDHKLNQVNKDL